MPAVVRSSVCERTLAGSPTNPLRAEILLLIAFQDQTTFDPLADLTAVLNVQHIHEWTQISQVPCGPARLPCFLAHVKLQNKVQHLSEDMARNDRKMCSDFACPPHSVSMTESDKFECRRGKCTEEECCVKMLDVGTALESN